MAMYRVLIADDEMPALRYLRSIIQQFSSQFEVVDAVISGEAALKHLQSETIDLLITDISMHGMSGIELAHIAIKLQPDIHIVIISGYGEFEYAQGAIQAGVDEYLLKPVSITKMTSLLQSIQQKLDSEQMEQAATLLPAIACNQPYDEAAAHRLYGREDWFLAYVLWGNLDMRLPRKLDATRLLPSKQEHFLVLRGRNDEECVLIAKDEGMENFLMNLSVFVTQASTQTSWTVVYMPAARPIGTLPDFIDRSLETIYQKAVIGKHQILKYSGGNVREDRLALSATTLRQLGYFVSSGKKHLVKDFFISQAVQWENGQLPQRQAWHMIHQIIYQLATVHQPTSNRLTDILMEIDELIHCASSYGDLMASIYGLVFDSDNALDRKMTTQELYDCAIQYIQENFAQPLSMQSVCDELGISQTYLSRLFRKYGNTTFNTYLTRCRMDAAIRILQEKPNMLLREVAACVGYEGSSYFSKVFHQYTGKTPSQYFSDEDA